MKAAEQYQRQSLEFEAIARYLGATSPERINRAVTIKPGKSLALIELFALDVGDQIGIFHDLHSELVNS